MKKEYLCELIEERLHNMERECDLFGDEERVKKLEKSKKCDGEACCTLCYREIFPMVGKRWPMELMTTVTGGL